MTISDNKNLDEIFDAFKSQIHQITGKQDNNTPFRNYLPLKNEYNTHAYSTDQTQAQSMKKKRNLFQQLELPKREKANNKKVLTDLNKKYIIEKQIWNNSNLKR